MFDNLPHTRFDSGAEVESCLRAIEQRLRLLESLFTVCFEARHRDVEVDLGAGAYAALADFCRATGNDLANLRRRLPLDVIGLRLGSLVPRGTRRRSSPTASTARARKPHRRGERGHAAQGDSQVSRA